jgi:hypothetical protein
VSTSAREAGPNTPVGVDPNRASVARIYDFLLGGKDNYDIDRRTAAEIATVMPEVRDLALENRAFLIRIVRFLAMQTGVTQYLDCGSGLPTAENVHQVAQRLNLDSRVVYVDHDPVVLAHGKALLEQNDQTKFIPGDIFEPRSILDDEIVRSHLDWTQPIALLLLATLHHHKGERHEPADVMREYIDALPSGSFVAISHIFAPDNDDAVAMQQLEEVVAKGSLGGATARSQSEIEELFHGLEMVQPGVVELANWWPDGPRFKPLNVAQRLIVGGIARKP